MKCKYWQNVCFDKHDRAVPHFYLLFKDSQESTEWHKNKWTDYTKIVNTRGLTHYLYRNTFKRFGFFKSDLLFCMSTNGLINEIFI